MGEQHAHHLHNVLKEHYDITKNWKRDLYAGINLAWDYVNLTCCLIMDNYIINLLLKNFHPDPNKPQHPPHKHTQIQYGAKIQYANETPNSPQIKNSKIICVQ